MSSSNGGASTTNVKRQGKRSDPIHSFNNDSTDAHGWDAGHVHERSLLAHDALYHGRMLRRQSDPASSLTLDSSLARNGDFSKDGLEDGSIPGFSASLKSTNNFINFCATSGLPINSGDSGQQEGFCSPTPMGVIASPTNMPSVKFVQPLHNSTITDIGGPITIQIRLRNFASGSNTNSQTKFFAAPQQIASDGRIAGSVGVVIESIGDILSTAPPNPRNFVFYKTLFPPDVGGLVSTDVTGALQPGVYRLSSRVMTANRQPPLVGVVQRGAFDDAVYFTVRGSGTGPGVSTARAATVPLPPNRGGASQSTLTLDPSVIAQSYAEDGLGGSTQTSGLTASLTSTNNFINFCVGQIMPTTGGKQISNSATCNSAPMGLIPPIETTPAAKFVFPKNGDTIPPDIHFEIVLGVLNFQGGVAVNSATNYLGAPQQLNSNSLIMGHAHVVVEQVSSFQQTDPTDPNKFAFFKEMIGVASDGRLRANITEGLSPGTYRMSSQLVAANHQPVLVAGVQRGSVDDVVYFTVSGDSSGTNANTIPAGNDATSIPPSGATARPSTTGSGPATAATGASAATSGSVNVGAVAGGIVGGIVIGALLLFLFLLYRRRQQRLAASDVIKVEDIITPMHAQQSGGRNTFYSGGPESSFYAGPVTGGTSTYPGPGTSGGQSTFVPIRSGTNTTNISFSNPQLSESSDSVSGNRYGADRKDRMGLVTEVEPSLPEWSPTNTNTHPSNPRSARAASIAPSYHSQG